MATALVTDEPDAALGQDAADGDDSHLREVHSRALTRFDDAVLPQQDQRRSRSWPAASHPFPAPNGKANGATSSRTRSRSRSTRSRSGSRRSRRDYRENRIVPDFRPAGGDSDQETADTLDGIHRADSYNFKAQQARDNAFEEAAAGGFGAYRLTNEWDDPYDPDSDAQRINPAMVIVDADQRVFFDPNSKLYDKSDAGYLLRPHRLFDGGIQGRVRRRAGVVVGEGLAEGRRSTGSRPKSSSPPNITRSRTRTEKLLILTHRLSNEEQRWWSEIEADELADLQARGFVKSGSAPPSAGGSANTRCPAPRC
jgi:hypothetical protein